MLLNLIKIKYRHNDFNKGFMQGLIAATTNLNTDDDTIPGRQKVCLGITILSSRLLLKVGLWSLWLLHITIIK